MTTEKPLDELESRRRKVRTMGGEAKIEARRRQGIMNARERVDAFCDAGTFTEVGEFAHSPREEDRDRTPAEGIVTGFGRVDGREVAVASFDLTTLGASSSLGNIRKLGYLKQSASRAGIPCAFLIESAGARMPDIQGAVGMGRVGQMSATDRLRDVPWVTAVLGPCYGMGSWYTVQSDFAVMRRDATFSVSSPKVISVALSQDVTPEELGGSDLHAEVTGQIDMVTETDAQALAALRTALSYLPSNSDEPAPIATGEIRAHPQQEIDALIPTARNRIYDGRKLLEGLGGRRVGHALSDALRQDAGDRARAHRWATGGHDREQPHAQGGAIDAQSCDKMTEFVVLCDSFNIPILLFADTPGFLVGLEPERAGVAGKIMNNLRALSLATVPKLAVVVRKSYGQAYLNMGGGVADAVAVMTTGEVGFVDPAVAMSVVHNRRPQEGGDDYDALLKDMVVSNSPFELAGIFAAHAVIRPAETRDWLIRMLKVHRRRRGNGVGEHRLSSWPTSL